MSDPAPEPGGEAALDGAAPPRPEEAPRSGDDRAADSPVVELEGLEVRFGRLRALRGVSASLGGRAIGLLGPNGAGKTTLLHTLLGFYRPSAGTARVLGRDIRRQATEVRSLLGYMPERDAFIAGINGVRFVRMMAELSGLPAEQALERAHEALFYVGLGEARYRPMESYSLGMKQLAKLAQAVVHGPRLLLLDEPTAGLDPPARERMLRLIREIRDSGEVRLILSSHLLRDVEECCDEVLVLKDGEIAAYTDLAEERRTNRRFLELETRGGGEPFTEAVRGLGCELALAAPTRIKAVLPEGVAVADLYRLAREHGVQLRRVSYRRDSLEDIFLEAMEGRGALEPGAGPLPERTVAAGLSGQAPNQPSGQAPNQPSGQAPNQPSGQAPDQPSGQPPEQPPEHGGEGGRHGGL